MVYQPSEHFLDRVEHEAARRHLVLGVEGDAASGMMRVLHPTGLDSLVLHNLSVHIGRLMQGIEHDGEEIARLIDHAYETRRNQTARFDLGGDTPMVEIEGPEANDAASMEDRIHRVAAEAERDLLNTDGKGPVVRLVDSIVFDAVGRGASDIHIQPLGDATLIRYRIDGVLQTLKRVSPQLAPAIVSRIKIMARMDVAERREAQDGRATVTIGGRGGIGARKSVDLRISSLPSTFGERVVIRLLYHDHARRHTTIETLGMPEPVLKHYLDRAGRSSGIVLITGPTGSGKTTTLYATLRWLIGRSFTGKLSADVNVMTIEDPVEYDLSASESGGNEGGRPIASVPISQTQVDVKKGITFAAGLRHILRQDPDVIMVGEIRDGETAKIAIQASLTGHLVFSTLHTNDAPGAISRLIDLGVEPFLVASSLSAVLAQRLVRTTHQACRGEGCAICLHSGFKGRRGIFELLVMDDAIRQATTDRAATATIKDLALRGGMTELLNEGRRLVREGVTNDAEVHRVTLGIE